MKELCFEANLQFNYIYELSRLCCTNKPLLKYDNCSSECERQGRFQAGWSEAMRVDYSKMILAEFIGFNFGVKIFISKVSFRYSGRFPFLRGRKSISLEISLHLENTKINENWF